MNNPNRRSFIKKAAMVSFGLGLGLDFVGAAVDVNEGIKANRKRIGMLGLDTGHCVAFTKTINISPGR